MAGYIRVSEEEGDDAMEIPVESDGTLLLSTLVAQYSGACGLKFRHPSTKSLRGVRLVDDRLVPPEEGWDFDFICTFPKVDGKRKSSDLLESATYKTKKLEVFRKCSDLIVLGLPWKTTEEDLKTHFATYGAVLMAQVKKDAKTGQSKGYGFIRFDDYDVQKRVLAMRHMIDGRTCDVKIPNSKDGSNPFLSGKVFVGRTTEDLSSEDLRDYFEKFGEVTDVFIPKPFRAFSFVTFLDPEVAQKLCGEDHIIKGVSVNVSSATPKGESQRGGGGNFGGRGQFGGGDRSGGFNQRGGISNWNQGQGWNYGNGGNRGGGGNWNQGGGNWNSGGGGDMGGFDPKNLNMNALTVPIMAALSQQLLNNMSNVQQQQQQQQPQQQQQQQSQQQQSNDLQGSNSYNQSQGGNYQQQQQPMQQGGGNNQAWSSQGRDRFSR